VSEAERPAGGEGGEPEEAGIEASPEGGSDEARPDQESGEEPEE
jgi:hypothetical protein